jgi:hypothetical protein
LRFFFLGFSAFISCFLPLLGFLAIFCPLNKPVQLILLLIHTTFFLIKDLAQLRNLPQLISQFLLLRPCTYRFGHLTTFSAAFFFLQNLAGCVCFVLALTFFLRPTKYVLNIKLLKIDFGKLQKFCV